jgi:hypothetical protein
MECYAICQYILETNKWSLRLMKVYSILSTPWSFKWSLSFMFLHQNPVSMPLLQMCCISHTFHSPRVHQQNAIW